jgi:hypothetical protein
VNCYREVDISLWQAAVIAYKEVFTTRPSGHVPTNDELDLVALVLSGYLPIYGSRAAGESGRIAESDLAQGMFWGGARRFESRRNPQPLAALCVSGSELKVALERLRADLWSGP